MESVVIIIAAAGLLIFVAFVAIAAGGAWVILDHFAKRRQDESRPD